MIANRTIVRTAITQDTLNYLTIDYTHTTEKTNATLSLLAYLVDFQYGFVVKINDIETTNYNYIKSLKTLNITGLINGDVIEVNFRGLQVGSVILEGKSYDYSEDREEIDIAIFGDSFNRTELGSKKITLTIEAYKETSLIKDIFKNSKTVLIEIYDEDDDEYPIICKGKMIKKGKKTEQKGVINYTYEFSGQGCF